jgi:hypothetical protein
LNRYRINFAAMPYRRSNPRSRWGLTQSRHNDSRCDPSLTATRSIWPRVDPILRPRNIRGGQFRSRSNERKSWLTNASPWTDRHLDHGCTRGLAAMDTLPKPRLLCAHTSSTALRASDPRRDELNRFRVGLQRCDVLRRTNVLVGEPIATPETQAETILLAQQSSIADLARAAAVRRGKLAEERQKVQEERFLSFTKHGDNHHTRITPAP